MIPDFTGCDLSMMIPFAPTSRAFREYGDRLTIAAFFPDQYPELATVGMSIVSPFRVATEGRPYSATLPPLSDAKLREYVAHAVSAFCARSKNAPQ